MCVQHAQSACFQMPLQSRVHLHDCPMHRSLLEGMCQNACQAAQPLSSNPHPSGRLTSRASLCAHTCTMSQPCQLT